MNTNELRKLLKEVFYEDEYKISETDYITYSFPKGGIEEGESQIDAAIRNLKKKLLLK